MATQHQPFAYIHIMDNCLLWSTSVYMFILKSWLHQACSTRLKCCTGTNRPFNNFKFVYSLDEYYLWILFFVGLFEQMGVILPRFSAFLLYFFLSHSWSSWEDVELLLGFRKENTCSRDKILFHLTGHIIHQMSNDVGAELTNRCCHPWSQNFHLSSIGEKMKKKNLTSIPPRSRETRIDEGVSRSSSPLHRHYVWQHVSGAWHSSPHKARLVVIFTDGCLMCHAAIPRLTHCLAAPDYSHSSEGSRGQRGRAF